jgi:diketogulonate reductase-like aldo/keto reductase
MTHVQPLIDVQSKYKIVTQAYASLAPTTRHPTGGPLKPVLAKIASTLTSESEVEVDESGVLLLWIMAKGGVCITSSSSEERIKKMADLEKVRDLKADEVDAIDSAGKKVHFRQWVSVHNSYRHESD